ncbi:non-ribosomal peptide synthetase [Paenibacillus monticola]|uniref:Amino acid adenylation domain-containing protein n=1 Tax=Paenibacillus monticola TaxID=2666075 RepID=A0A7X2L0L8_9BACL|nr:non-ribosomal peptide synthetase [Paenibacillus monticola]MRN52283.1 amino acid adenylation domain-containing protein [Paenibacillus monticola]
MEGNKLLNSSLNVYGHEERRTQVLLDQKLTQQLWRMAERMTTTLDVVILSATVLLLHKYFQQEIPKIEVITGSDLYQGVHSEHGLIKKVIPLQYDVSNYSNIKDLLLNLNLLKVDNNERTGLLSGEDNVQAAIGEDEHDSYLKVLFMLNTCDPDRNVISLMELMKNIKLSETDLLITPENEGGQIQLNLRYGNQVSDDTIHIVKSNILHILHSIQGGLETDTSEFRLINIAEEKQLLLDFNCTKLTYNQNLTLKDLFEAQVQCTPDQTALIFNDEAISYKELNRRANHLATILREKGVSPDRLVGLLLERTPDLIIGMIAILKAGGAYVPIDVTYPKSRIEYILNDSGISLMITNASISRNFTFTGEKIEVESLGYLSEDITNLMTESKPDDLAYVIYTSGTTGQPKGVMITQDNVHNFMCGILENIPLAEGSSMLALTTHSFDIFVLESLVPLMRGATIVLASQEQQQSPRQIGLIMKQASVRIIQMTPTRCKAFLVDPLFLAALKDVEYILLGGEPLPLKLLEALQSVSSAAIFNMYGPTETTIWSSLEAVTGSTVIRIGKPMANTQFYILDNQGELVPIGEEGELYIGGRGLARGYLNRNDLTNERFIVNPLTGKGLIYRTGDLVKWTNDGRVEYVGRCDEQVKMRGYRIELGEIENLILRMESITEASVIPISKDGEIQGIHAFYVAELTIPSEVITAHLAEYLPEYMLPVSYTQIECLPQTPNGKINKKALLESLVDARIGEFAAYIPPNSPHEILISRITQEIFQEDRISVEQNLLLIGGHSLKFMELSSRIHQDTGSIVPSKYMFSKPTIKSIANYVDNELKSEYYPIETAAVQDSYPVTSMQKRMFLLQDNSGADQNMPEAYLLEGVLDVVRLERALEQLIQRHDILRANFYWEGEELVQRINEVIAFQLECVDVHDGDLAAMVSSYVFPFDLTHAPLFRAILFKIGPSSNVLLLEMHHIITDNVSMKVFLRDLEGLYEGKAQESVKIQYQDYSVWMKNHPKELSSKREFWMQQLSGDLPVLDLPTDYVRPMLQSFEGETLDCHLDQQLTAKLKGIAAETGTTLYMVLFSMFKILLSKYSGQEDILVGSVSAGRTHADIHRTMGMFVNTFVVRSFPNGNKNYKEYLLELKDIFLDVFDNQDYPFEDLANELHRYRDLSRNPLFDVMFVMEEKYLPSLKGIQAEPYQIATNTSRFDLTLVAEELRDSIQIKLEYRTKLFSKETIERIIKHFQYLVVSIVHNTDLKISEYEMMDAEEYERIVHTFNNTDSDYNSSRTYVQWFEDQVERTPDGIALVHQGMKLTYRQVNQESNRLARALCKKGVKQGDIIGVLASRGIKLIVAMLGVMKAGGTYLPLDPEYPEIRLQYMLENSDTKLLLTDLEQPYLLINQINTININFESFCHEDEHNLNNYISSDNAAYMIYTSGSTGKPKGVVLGHKGISNLSVFFKHELGVQQSDKIVQFASMSFDASIWEITMALFNGAQLHLITNEIASDYKEFENYLQDNEITIATLPPTYLLHLDPARATSLRILITAGSSVTYELAERWGKSTEFINAYGPTESTICSTFWRYSQQERTCKTVPIGKPVLNAKAYVLNQNDRLLPVGIIGELCISGDMLAIEYYRSQAVTSEKFITNPFDAGTRIYKTGDLVRWLPDGNLEFIGRKDDQVKIRGFRIEMGELKSQLLQYESIQDATILCSRARNNEEYLYAYLVSDTVLNPRHVREFLSTRLPQYMIPTYLLQIDAIPLTINGKVDTKALPDAEAEINSQRVVAAARNQTEEKLVSIWKEILDIEEVDINDNFFERGGHSLKVAYLIRKIAQEFGVRFTFKKLFEYSSISKISSLIENSRRSTIQSLELSEKRSGYPCSSAQKRMYSLYEQDKHGVSYNLPNAMLVEGDLERVRIEDAFKQMINRHESFRTFFEIANETVIQKIKPNVNFEISYVELKSERQEDIDQKIKEFIKPFNLEKSTLLRVELVKLSDNKHLLLWDTHHIVFDGFSAGLFMQEYMNIYRQEPLPELKYHYHDFAIWEEKVKGSLEWKQKERFWLEQLAGEIPVLDLPYDYTRPVVKSFEGDSIDFELQGSICDDLNKLATETGTTLYMLLLSTYKILLSKYSGQEELIVGSVSEGRPHLDLQQTLGMFVNTFAVRTYPEGNKRYCDYLDEVKSYLLDAFDNQDYPIQSIPEKLLMQRDISRNPLFDTLFVLENMHIPAMKLEGMNITPVRMKSQTSKFDLSMIAEESVGKINFRLEYCTRLFKESSVERLKNHFIQLISDIVKHPDKLISELCMLAPGEEQQILNAFNNTATEYPASKTVNQLFEEQVEKSPSGVALIFDKEEWTYQQLNRRSNQIARKLQSLGVRSEQPVGIMLDRGFDLIAAIIGILKAGAGYLPLDSDYPEERLHYMLSDSNCEIVLTTLPFADKVNKSANLVFLDDPEIAACGEDNLVSMNTVDSLIYIMYTSGSTGKPKGVLVKHQNVVRLVVNAEYMEFSSSLKMLQGSTTVFDASTFEIWGALLNGMSLCIVTKETMLESDKLHQVLKQQQIKTMWLTSALFNQHALEKPEMFADVKYLLVGGDVLSIQQIDAVQKMNQGLTIINGYGPTENTTFSTCFTINGGYEMSIPIGKPISNSKAYLLDKYGKLLPIGVIGELYLGGDGVAGGYLNDSEKTREKFLPDPYALGKTIYRTGDLARWLPDGNLEFCGRKDQQLKIRGFRIETGEIEWHLMNYPSIKETVVISKEDRLGNKCLCAYFIASQEVNPAELRLDLLTKLPDYMMPSYYIQLESFPLTVNGKVDKQALPQPTEGMLSSSNYQEPRNKTEELLCKVWKEILASDQVGITDHFFELGGDSIKAIQLASRMKRYNLRVDVRDILIHPRINELSSYVLRLNHEVEQDKVTGEVVLTPVQRWFFENQSLGRDHFNQSMMLYHEGQIDKELVFKVFQAILSHHDALRMVVDDQGEEPSQLNRGIEYNWFDLYEFDCCDEEDSRAFIERKADEIQQSIKLTEGSLVKVAVFHEKMGTHLFIAVHHLVIDGVSWRILLEDIVMAYEQLSSGEVVKLPSKTHSFQAWAKQLKEYANSETLILELEFWNTMGNHHVSKLPMDYEFAEHITMDSDEVQMQLSYSETEQLIKQCNKAYNTEINDLLLAALGLTLKKWTHEDNILINLESHGRENIFPNLDIGRTVGWFTSIYPVVIHMDNSTKIEDTIISVKETLRKVPNKGIGYGILNYLTPAALLKGSKPKVTPEISFNYMGQFNQQELNHPRFKYSSYLTGNEVSPYYGKRCNLDLNGIIKNNQFNMTISYSSRQFAKCTIEMLAESYKDHLLRIINFCAEKEGTEHTPSDFSAKDLDFDSMKEVLDLFN